MRSRRLHSCSHRRFAVAIAAALLVSAACSNPYNRHANQSRRARQLVPRGVGTIEDPSVTNVRTLKVRVYADQKYRVQVLRWKRKFEGLITRSNQVIGGLGIELEVVDALPWQRSAPDNKVLASVQELALHDPGNDVDWVVGLVTALPEVSSSIHQLGGAQLLSKHMVVRASNDTAERKMIDAAFGALDEAEREALYRKRKSHKELVTFLHEWGHTLGAMHVSSPTSIMYPAYEAESWGFARPNLRVMAISLKYRKSRALTTAELADWYAELGAYLNATEWSGWDGRDKRDLIAALDAGPEVSEGPRVSTRLTPDGRRAFLLAVDYLDNGDLDKAWRTIEPLTEQYDDESSVMLLGCRIAVRARGIKYPAPKLCERAAALLPGDAAPFIAMANAYFVAHDTVAALGWLRKAHAVLDDTAETDVAAYWLSLAAEYQRHSLITWLEQALVGATPGPTTAELTQWAALTRARYGLPPDGDKFGIPPEREGEYLNVVKKILEYTYGSQYSNARLVAKQALAAFPKGPGVHAALCDLELRVGRAKTALKRCKRALALWDGAAWAQYLSGNLAARQRKHTQAVKHLERAVELDPTVKGAWQLLHREYEAARMRDAAARLASEYRARFGEPL